MIDTWYGDHHHNTTGALQVLCGEPSPLVSQVAGNFCLGDHCHLVLQVNTWQGNPPPSNTPGLSWRPSDGSTCTELVTGWCYTLDWIYM
uniref:Uncharacterized protein n=1 Tax=Engystomops pustulosus TaxID=76066 RepID=A0AAV6YF69_ENGPU|nr:hypothetical protein GDO81_018505 [Engystomops pustulosus]